VKFAVAEARGHFMNVRGRRRPAVGSRHERTDKERAD
jgi:hypothetical protein